MKMSAMTMMLTDIEYEEYNFDQTKMLITLIVTHMIKRQVGNENDDDEEDDYEHCNEEHDMIRMTKLLMEAKMKMMTEMIKVILVDFEGVEHLRGKASDSRTRELGFTLPCFSSPIWLWTVVGMCTSSLRALIVAYGWMLPRAVEILFDSTGLSGK